MTIAKRNCVFVALCHTVGHDLVFRHVTNKVVVGTYRQANREDVRPSAKINRRQKP